MTANYPFNIAVGQNNSIYVNVGNHLGSSAYYILYVRCGNRTDLSPNTPLENSSLVYLYEYRLPIPDSGNWERSFEFFSF